MSQDELSILPLGNSITYGWYDGTYSEGERISYRYRLYNLLNAAGYNYSYKGHISSGYSYLPVAYSKNGGISGVRDNQLADVMETGRYWDPNISNYVNVSYPNAYLDVPAHQCDLILLHIGTNDVYNGDYNASAVNDILDAIDDYETTYSTDVLVIVAKIISTKHVSGSCTMNSGITNYNNSLQSVINTRIAGGDKLILTDMQCDADIDYETDMLNTLHPATSGYNLMGDKWFEVIDGIHDAPVISAINVTPINEGGTFSTINLDLYVSDDYTSDSNIDWTLESEPENLDVTINPDHTVTVTPLDPDWYGTEVVTFIATDKGRYIEKLHKSSTRDVTFTVNNINDPPVILSQLTTFNLQEDSSFDLELSDLEVEDPDNEYTDLNLNILPGDNYTVEGSTVSPDENYEGTMNVNVTVSDLEDESNAFLVSVYFSPINDAPVITGSLPIDPLDISEPYEITMDDLIVDDPDNDIEDLTLYVLGGSNYTVESHVITPYSGYYGDLSVNVRVRDFEKLSNVYGIPITVEPSNLPPEFITQMNDTLVYPNIQFLLETLAEDPNDDPISYFAASVPDFLDFVESVGILMGIPGTDDSGSYQISIGATDGLEASYLEFTLTVNGPNAINTEILSDNINIYPNPAWSTVNIAFEEPIDIDRVSIVDMSGRRVFTQKIDQNNGDSITLDVSGVAQGSYMLFLESENAVVHSKLVIGRHY